MNLDKSERLSICEGAIREFLHRRAMAYWNSSDFYEAMKDMDKMFESALKGKRDIPIDVWSANHKSPTENEN